MFVAALALCLGGCTQLLGDFSLEPSDGAAGDSAFDATADAASEGAGPSDDSSTGADTDASQDTGTEGSTGDGAQEPDAEGGAGEGGGCPTGNLACDGGCVPDDLHNCGACGNDCAKLNHVDPSTLKCSNGSCVYYCASGYANCADAGDGCDTNLAQQGNCGACGVTCSGGTPVCTASGGSPACGNGCPSNEKVCGSSCTDTTSDSQNCGACNHACSTTVANAHASCSSSTCSYACDPTYTACGGGCYATQTDPDHCGSSCTVCPGVTHGTATCAGGTCGFTCNSGYAACGGACFQTQTDSSHCGSSCAMCSGGQSCVGGSCTCPGSSPNFCNGACTDEQTDEHNCGACGHDCLGGTCSKGMCQSFTVGGGQNLDYVATDGTNIFWTDNFGLHQSPAAGGTSILLSSGGAGEPVYAGGAVYFGDGSGLVKAKIGQPNSAVTVLNVQGYNLALNPAATHLFYSDSSNGIHDCVLGGSCATVGPSGATAVYGIAADSTYMFSVVSGSSGSGLFRESIGGSSSANVGIFTPANTGLVDDGAYVYWAATSGSTTTTYRAAVGNPTAVQTIGNNMYPFASDGKKLYYSDRSTGIYAMPMPPGSGSAVQIVGGLGSASNALQMVITGKLLAWADDGSTITAVVVP